MRLSGGPQETSYQIEDTVCSYGESAGFLKSLNISGEGDVLCLFRTVTLLITLLAKRFRFSLVFFFCVYLFVCVVWIFYTLKGPSQSQLCFCLHARVWLWSMSKWRKPLWKYHRELLTYALGKTTKSRVSALPCDTNLIHGIENSGGWLGSFKLYKIMHFSLCSSGCVKGLQNKERLQEEWEKM